MSDRRKAHGFRAERQAKFSKNVRKQFLEDGRERKDAERARMEAYRRLCEAEGIKSQRLEDYDKARKTTSKNLDKALEAVDYDQSLTNNEKKRRKFNLKRKFAATTVTDILDREEKRYNAVTAAEEIAKKRQEAREQARAAREEREKQKSRRVDARKSRQAHYKNRTTKGQPVMASRLECLLDRINR